MKNKIVEPKQEELKKLTKELRISPLYTRFCELQEEGELEKGSMSYLDFIYDLVSYVTTSRNDHRIRKTIEELKLRHTSACLDNIIFDSNRTGITKKEITEFNTCNWIRSKRSMIVAGATGTGKTYIADMLAISAITSGLKVYFNRMPMLYSDLSMMTASEFNSFKNQLKKQDLIYIDDFALGKITPEVESMLVEIADECAGRNTAFLLTTQTKVSGWIENYFSDRALAEAFCDRIANSTSIRITLEGDSLRSMNSGTINGTQSTPNGTDLTTMNEDIGTKNGTKKRRGRPPKNKENNVNSNNNDKPIKNGKGTKLVPVPSNGTNDGTVVPVPKVPSDED
ncbi:MAG: ATP-binding protein [Succinivibrio sp.]